MAAMPKSDPGWIDCGRIDEILQTPIRIMTAVDGTDVSMCGFEYIVRGLMQQERVSFVQVMHVFDETKTYLPPQWRKDQLSVMCDTLCTSYLLPKRYRLLVVPRQSGEKIGVQLVREIRNLGADFMCMGFFGRKGRKRRSKQIMASNVMEVMQRGRCSTIVMQNEDVEALPIGRPTIFVVSVSLNQAATKAFIDALRLSKPGDEIHVVYIKSYMERTESDYTTALRQKYNGIFESLQGEHNQEVLAKFGDRVARFQLVPKQMRETTSMAVCRYADEVDADFIIVGTNTMRVDRGKPFLGSVSLQICLETDRNFVVSHWDPGAAQKEGAYLK